MKTVLIKSATLLALLILAGASLTSCVCYPMHMRSAKVKSGGTTGSAACPLPRGAHVERLENWAKYYQGGVWEMAFRALEKVTPETPDGTYPILGDDIRMLVSTYTTGEPEKAVVESHREFIDIQMVLTGVDQFRWWSVPGLTVKAPYDPVKDIIFYEMPDAPLAEFTARPGFFAVFTPYDAHATVMNVPGQGPAGARKAVIKIRANLVCPRGTYADLKK